MFETVKVTLSQSPVLSKSEFVDGLHTLQPMIRDFVEHLDKSLGNSKDLVLELHDGQHVVIPLFLCQSPETLSEFSVSKEEAIPVMSSIPSHGQSVSWADECDKVLDSVEVVMDLEGKRHGTLLSGCWIGIEVVRRCGSTFGEKPKETR